MKYVACTQQFQFLSDYYFELGFFHNRSRRILIYIYMVVWIVCTRKRYVYVYMYTHICIEYICGYVWYIYTWRWVHNRVCVMIGSPYLISLPGLAQRFHSEFGHEFAF